jgi:hypothetical protein
MQSFAKFSSLNFMVQSALRVVDYSSATMRTRQFLMLRVQRTFRTYHTDSSIRGISVKKRRVNETKSDDISVHCLDITRAQLDSMHSVKSIQSQSYINLC